MTIEDEVKNILHNYLVRARGVYSVGNLADDCYAELKKYLKAENITVIDETDLGKVITDGTASEVNDG